MANELIRENAYIDGRWVAAGDNATFAVNNPATSEVLGRVADLGATDTRTAIAAADNAFQTWRHVSARDRGRILRNWADLIRQNRNLLAEIITLEQGKPLTESKGEVAYGLSFIEWFAEEARRVYGDIIPAASSNNRYLTIKQPIGVAAAITPWNFPVAMLTRKCAPALAVGCTVVAKPAEATPLSALALAELAGQAGFPPGVFNVLPTSSGERVGDELCSNPAVRKLSFTGSTATGKHLMRRCADTVKRVSMELGGNAPFVVFADADIDKAVAGVMAAKYRNTGQTCISANRILVQDEIYTAFVDKLTAQTERLVAGDGMTKDVRLGPLINEAALEKVDRHVNDAVSQGATVRCGGKPHELGGTFYAATVLADVTTDMLITTEETFGPVAAVYRFATERDAIQLANNTSAGLAAYVYTSDIGRSWRVAEALEYGMVGVNEAAISNETAPFGGIKESGIGREGSRYGVDDYLEIKYMCLGGIDAE